MMHTKSLPLDNLFLPPRDGLTQVSWNPSSQPGFQANPWSTALINKFPPPKPKQLRTIQHCSPAYKPLLYEKTQNLSFSPSC